MPETKHPDRNLTDHLLGSIQQHEPANIALMHLLSMAADEASARSALYELELRPGNPEVEAAVKNVRALWQRLPAAFGLVRKMRYVAERGFEHGCDWSLVFDEASGLSPEASVALYSLGNPTLLVAATEELVRRMAQWNLLCSHYSVMDMGCGIGRVAAAIAPSVGQVVAVDLSEEMARHARRNLGMPNVWIVLGSGRDLRFLADESFDSVLAIDSFPYMVESGVAAVHLSETARVLRSGGRLLIMNYSYRGDLDLDRAEIGILAERERFRIHRNGTRDLSFWDGRAFLLQKL
jgi:SAM-dependent methyltransferase